MPKIGNKNNNNTSVPTLAEYISTQIVGKRAAALDKSRNRTSVRVPMISNYETEEHWKHRLNTTIKNAEELLSRLMASGENGDYAKAKQQELDALLEELDKGYPKLISGANCMYNAGDCYGLNIPGNETFAAKHKELGFQKTPKGSMEPGDLVQDVRMGYPTHAMIYDSKDDENNLLFNYARGYNSTSVEENYVKQGKYPLPIKDYDVYKYVGTPADSTQWINEYKQRYGNGMRCGGRRKAQLGLDIREGGIAIPIANNMWYIHGRKHEDGGVTMGPNNKNGVEVEGGEVVEMIDSNHPSVGRQFKAGGQQQTMRVFSSVPFLRGASPAELVLGGANPDAVFKAQEEFKDRNRINDDGTTYENGGKIAIEGAKTIGGYLPFVGTALDAYELYKNPSWKQAGWTALGLVSDVFTGGSARAVIKTARNLKNAKEALSIVRGPITKRIYKDAAVDAIKANIKARKNVIQDATFNVGQNYTQYMTDKYEMGGERKSKSKRSRPVTGVLPYGYTIRNLYAVENPYRKGIKGNVAKMYDSRTLGAGVDVVSGHPELYKKAKSGKITKKQADETAVVHLRKDDNAIRSNYADVYGKAAADTLSYGPRFLVAQARYQQGNVRKAWRPIHKAMAKGDAKALKKAVLQVTPKDHSYRRKWIEDFKVYKMGGMIYTINGNVKNGLSLRPKAKYGKIDRKNKDEKVGPDGLIYKRAADGEWYTDGTKHVTARPIVKNSRNDLVDINNGLMPTIIDRNGHYVRVKSIIPKDKKIITRKFDKPKRTYVGGYDEEEKETKKIGSLTYEKNESGKWVPSVKQSTTTTRDGGRPKDFGMTRTGVNHPNGSYKYHPLTGEKISEMGVTETSEPSVKGTTKVTSKPSSTARGEGIKTSTPKATTKGADVKYGTPLKEKKESLYITGIKNNSITPLRAGMEKIKSPSSTGGGTQSKDGRWVGQYKTTNVGDWIGLGSNLAGTIASYFMTKNAINKMPEPIKPVMAQAAKLKTRYNVEPQLSEIREAEQMNRAAVRRNTQSSNTSLAREQRLMNEARGARNTLYGQKENIETQLINQDRLNRQSVMKDNVRAYNEYLNRLTATKMTQNEMRVSNINNLISGLTGSVNSILGNIESRRATNNTLRAIAAANPNVDARLIGGFDYYIDPITKKKYNKNQQYVGTING